ncbi:uncharacterized protein MAM_02030 [Metarhizium album ARSEF 1941]|uniref:Uncharacterized protein n=1 Tax=Metarhizium album (strain ARSEF 1941) TaxID=1081103 RepID=A0A0B2WVG2_METAS|nr:uncharacterized protein MAM_02030 [Metarhizium album ARSEF 1941]KHO00107.1 hypothetical protein MAM_02030 [Metarhizium album ARSEF 1941]
MKITWCDEAIGRSVSTWPNSDQASGRGGAGPGNSKVKGDVDGDNAQGTNGGGHPTEGHVMGDVHPFLQGRSSGNRK